MANRIKVKGHTRKNGVRVKGHIRHVHKNLKDSRKEQRKQRVIKFHKRTRYRAAKAKRNKRRHHVARSIGM